MRKKPATITCPSCKTKLINPAVMRRRKQARETMRKIRDAKDDRRLNK